MGTFAHDVGRAGAETVTVRRRRCCISVLYGHDADLAILPR
jgi:hypothetical protein